MLLLQKTRKPKKVLILSAEMGHGHMSAAKALKEGLEKTMGSAVHVEIVDFMGLCNKKFNRLLKKNYEKFAKSAPYMCNFVLERWNGTRRMKLLNLLNYPLVKRKIARFLHSKKPDLVVSTYPIWDHLTLKISRKTGIQPKFVSLITDSIIVHNAWITADADYRIVANEDTAKTLKKMGVKPARIKILGFPVRLDFLQETDRSSFLAKQELNPDKFTILFLAVSQRRKRYLDMLTRIREKNPDSNIIVICGRDTKSLETFSSFGDLPNVKIIGWTDEMPNFIKSADLVVTKAGGATVMECIAAKKPMIITKTIARHELGNALLVQKYKLGIYNEKRKTDISKSIEKIKNNAKYYRRNLGKVSCPQAALEIARFLGTLIK